MTMLLTHINIPRYMTGPCIDGKYQVTKYSLLYVNHSWYFLEELMFVIVFQVRKIEPMGVQIGGN